MFESCLESLYKRAEAVREKSLADAVTEQQGIVLAELVTYMEESRAASENIQVFKIDHLTDMYTSRMAQRAATVTSHIHTSRLKESILARIADLGARRFRRCIA